MAKVEKVEFRVGEIPQVGRVLAAWTARGLRALFLGDDRQDLEEDLRREFQGAEIVERSEDERFSALMKALQGEAEVALDLHGTAFQQKVWRALRRIPAGQTVSYTELAEMIDAPKSARAVARACAANKIAVLVPCHRVLRADGKLSGYRWGVERKRVLLEREGALK